MSGAANTAAHLGAAGSPTFAFGDRVDARLTTLAKDWTPATYRKAATHMQGWHWVETSSGQRVCVHHGRVRRPR